MSNKQIQLKQSQEIVFKKEFLIDTAEWTLLRMIIKN